jgi:hypothetical protein
VSHLISVQLDALAALLADLAGLGAELDGEARLIAATGRSLATALAGPVGEEAAAAGCDGAELVTALATRVQIVTATLDAALDAYRRADAGLAGQLATGWSPGTPVPR